MQLRIFAQPHMRLDSISCWSANQCRRIGYLEYICPQCEQTLDFHIKRGEAEEKAMTDKECIEQLTGEVRALRLYVNIMTYAMTITPENKEIVGLQGRKAFSENMVQAQEELAERPIALEAFETTLEEVVSTGTLALMPLEEQ